MGFMNDFIQDEEQRLSLYRYGVYRHRITAPDGSVCIRPFIVIRNRYGVIVRFTNLHNFCEIYAGRTVIPISADAEKKLYYICKALNYIIIEHRAAFGIDSVYGVTAEALARFFRDYADKPMPNGKFRSAQSVGKCISAIVGFFMKLRRKHGDRVALKEQDLFEQRTFTNRYGATGTKKVPAFQVRSIQRGETVFRELPTEAFKALISLAFRYAPDIAFAMCLQAFAGLRAGEACNVRQERSPLGAGIEFTRIGLDVRKIEIDLTRELQLRSDGVVTGRIKSERKQCVYSPFLDAFNTAYGHHARWLEGRPFEPEYAPMFLNNYGKAMTYGVYHDRFAALVKNHFQPAMLRSENPELRIYGQMLCENTLGLHSLRHWYSVQLVLHGEDIAQIQYLRGDRSPESAFLYLQNKGDLVRELERTSGNLAGLLIEIGKRDYDGIDFDDGKY
jgi:integrase